MSQLHFYVPDEVEKQLRKRAKQANLHLSRFLAELVKREASRPAQWPEGYFERVFSQWQGEPLHREPQGDYEQRADFKQWFCWILMFVSICLTRQTPEY